MTAQTKLIQSIQEIANVVLHPTTAAGFDPVMAVMPHYKNKPQRYLLNPSGELVGLNLAGAKLTDAQWQKILALEAFRPDLLQALNLRNNELQASPVTADMQALRHLDLCGNNISEFQPPRPLALEHVFLTGNELTSPPIEVVKQGREAILNYFRRLEGQGTTKIYEAKVLIVGSGGVGKTTLLRRLLQKDKAVMPTEAESTHGIEVYDMPPFDCGGEHPFSAHLWDFGGQEIYHATHQFFLTKRSLYILVADPRKEDTDFDYWLQIIQLLGAESPVIIVQNEKGGRSKEINLPGLQMQFGNVVSMHSLDLSKTDKLGALIEDIQARLSKLPHIGDKLPNSWASVRKDLEAARKEKHFVSAEKFYEICDQHGERDEEAIRLSQYLHDLGFMLHFQDDAVLKHTVILDNSWATEGVYAVLDSNPVKQVQKGKFSRTDAVAIWNEKEREKGKALFKGKHDELLQLMLKFEICYRLSDTGDDYIAAQLLPAAEPENSQAWPQEESLHLIFRYGFMPKGLMSRLIVRLNHLIKDHKAEAWQTGAILHRGPDTQARMLETYATKDIHISARGREAKDLLSRITEEIDRLNQTYKKIAVNKLVPCICSECRVNIKAPDWQKEKVVTLFDHKVLEKAREKGVEDLQCQISFEPVNVLRLIDSVFDSVLAKNKGLKIFLSSCTDDQHYLKDLKKQFSPLVRSGKFQLWDVAELKGGEQSEKTIAQELATFDIFLPLLSADYLADEQAMKQWDAAFDRHKRTGASIVPVILRPCTWMDTPFSAYKALPDDGKPVSKWDDQDEALQRVVEQLQMLIKT